MEPVCFIFLILFCIHLPLVQYTLAQEKSSGRRQQLAEIKEALKVMTQGLHETQEELEETKNEFKEMNVQFASVLEELRVVKNEIVERNGDIDILKAELNSTKRRLELTQETLTATNEELLVTKEGTDITALDTNRLKRKLRVIDKKVKELEKARVLKKVKPSEPENNGETRDMGSYKFQQRDQEILRRFARQEKLARIKALHQFQSQLLLSKQRVGEIEKMQDAQNHSIEQLISVAQSNTEGIDMMSADLVGFRDEMNQIKMLLEPVQISSKRQAMQLNEMAAAVGNIRVFIEAHLYRGTCLLDTDCWFKYGSCEGGVCDCETGYRYNATAQICESAHLYRGTCLLDTDCWFKYGSCEGGVCDCETGYRYNATAQICESVFNSACRSESDCGYDKAECLNSVCHCQTGYRFNANQLTCVSDYNRVCHAEIECGFSYGSCVENLCKCQPWYVFNEGSNGCIATTYKMPCISNNDCDYTGSECRYGRCQCKETLSFSPRENTCTTNCVTYGDTFQRISNKAIKHNNIAAGIAVSRERCMQRCASNIGQTCLSADYNFNSNTCNLNSQSSRTAPSAYLFYSDYDYYHRNCA